jgi:hypothetical protein
VPFRAAGRRGRGYNIGVAMPVPNPRLPPEPLPSRPGEPAKAEPAKSGIASLEARGVLIIAVLILILTLVRYWRHIPWGAR